MLEYPAARRVDVVDDLHGSKIIDPYRLLQQQNCPEVYPFVEEQKAPNRQGLYSLPGRSWFAHRLDALMKNENRQLPHVAGGRRFELRQSPQQQLPALWIVDVGGDERVLIDPNTMSREATRSIRSVTPRPDGRVV